jgi:hypothetical protein
LAPASEPIGASLLVMKVVQPEPFRSGRHFTGVTGFLVSAFDW